jgi:hypothetical protein
MGRSHPIGAVGHSLGGLILFDRAVDEADKDPLHYSSLVTFGSQAPFFHAISRRSRSVVPFNGIDRVQLPSTIPRWINLWDPWDPLAFVAERTFVLGQNRPPEDRRAEYDRDSGIWTHSSYWSRPELPKAIREAFGR